MFLPKPDQTNIRCELLEILMQPDCPAFGDRPEKPLRKLICLRIPVLKRENLDICGRRSATRACSVCLGGVRDLPWHYQG